MRPLYQVFYIAAMLGLTGGRLAASPISASGVYYTTIPLAAVIEVKLVRGSASIDEYYLDYQRSPRHQFVVARRSYRFAAASGSNGDLMETFPARRRCGEWHMSQSTDKHLIVLEDNQMQHMFIIAKEGDVASAVRMIRDVANENNEWLSKGGKPSTSDVQRLDAMTAVFKCDVAQ